MSAGPYSFIFWLHVLVLKLHWSQQWQHIVSCDLCWGLHGGQWVYTLWWSCMWNPIWLSCSNTSQSVSKGCPIFRMTSLLVKYHFMQQNGFMKIPTVISCPHFEIMLAPDLRNKKMNMHRPIEGVITYLPLPHCLHCTDCLIFHLAYNCIIYF